MPIEVAAVRGERFPSDSGKNPRRKWSRTRPSWCRLTLGAKDRQTVTIRSGFKPERVVVDPNVRVLQLRRQSAQSKL
jgi:hypothetical protein